MARQVLLIPGFFHVLRGVHVKEFGELRTEYAGATIILVVANVSGHDARESAGVLEKVFGFKAHAIASCAEFGPNLVEQLGGTFVVLWEVSVFPVMDVGCKVVERRGLHPDLVAIEGLFRGRESPREFSALPVPRELIATAIEGARRAPSAGNLQAYSMTLVLRREMIKALSKAALGQGCVGTAAGVVVFWAETAVSARRYGDRAELYAVQDATIACAHLELAMQSVGVLSRWVGAFRDEEVARAVGRSGRPVALLCFALGTVARGVGPGGAPSMKWFRSLSDRVGGQAKWVDSGWIAAWRSAGGQRAADARGAAL